MEKTKSSALECFAELGLSENESSVMALVMQQGPLNASAVASKLGFQKSAGYFLCERLARRGLLTAVSANNKRVYAPIEKRALLELVKQRQESFKKNVVAMISAISTAPMQSKRAKFTILEGWKGLAIAFGDHLKEKPPEYLVFSVSHPENQFARFRRFIKKFHDERTKLGIPARMIMSEAYRATLGRDRRKNKHTVTRFLDGNQLPIVASIYANKTLLILYSEEPIVVMIEDPSIATTFRAMFELIWKTTKE